MSLGVDKEQLKTMIRGLTKWYVKRDNTEVGEPNTAVGLLYDDVMFGIDRLTPATPQEPQTFKWCTDCREYDQEKHCCHRYSKVIRDTVAEIEQEPRSEWEQDHEILKAYSDGANEVLDKLRAEIEALPIAFTSSFEMKQDCLDIIDKYKGESEE